MSDLITDWRTGADLRGHDPFTYEEVADALAGAADLIEKDGWTQRSLFAYSSGSIRRCVRGGISDACHVFDQAGSGGGARYRREFALAKTAEAALGYWLADMQDPLYTDYVPEWNDAPEQTKDQVIAALRGCAEFVRGGDDESAEA